MSSHRRNIDKVPSLLLHHEGQSGGDAVEDAFQIDIDHLIPLLELEAFEWCLRHDPGIVDHDVNSSVGMHGNVDQLLDVITAGDVGDDGRRFAAPSIDLAASD